MGSEPSRQSDPQELENMQQPNPMVLPGRAPRKYPTSDVEANIRKHQSSSPGTKVSFQTTSRASQAEQVDGGCKSCEPDYPPQSASIKK